MSCEICNSELEVIYEGKVRHGKPGVLTEDSKKVVKCKTCSVAYLADYKMDYEGDEYRELVNDNSGSQRYYALHDKEQVAKLDVINVEDLRGKSIADVGTGAGSFLDLVSGFADKVIAVEPTMSFKEDLEAKGYIHYQYGSEAVKEFKEGLDYVTSFAVIEHVEDCENFLKDIYDMLKPGGTAIISTPNADDFHLDFIGKDYQEFYYRSVHKWYFNREALTNLAKRIGFNEVDYQYKQRFDFSNFMHWLKDRKPTGLAKINTFKDLDSSLQTVLERNGQSDYLYMMFKK